MERDRRESSTDNEMEEEEEEEGNTVGEKRDGRETRAKI